ncbi:hypothetical protein CASFOL_015485 [Castilleja foliolosa]|uniref:Glycosyltransferase 61 catalytic domain-containing protein n=1 Tax=Castilleja foliolosa TaxID=1961234 RepID=A0ABD3DHR9_9LAMI
MAHYSLFSRSFSKEELKNLRFGALFICFILAFSFLTFLNQPFFRPDSTQIVISSIHKFSNSRTDVLEITGDIRIAGNSSTIFLSSTPQSPNITSINPYPRKEDNFIMKNYVTLWKINHHNISEQNKLPKCHRRFDVPAVLFSSGGYTGNHFHDFTDTIIPLYLTARQFNRTVIFLITDKRTVWLQKYKLVLASLSNYDTIDIDKENRVLCFGRMIVGLRSHKELGIDPLQPPHYSMIQFRRFLRTTYSLHRHSINIRTCNNRPRMLIISRKDNRFIINEDEVADKARDLGFDVVVQEMGSTMLDTAKQVNLFDVMVGVHGAGLTNMLFLPENGVIIQIIPFGADLWAKPYFGMTAKDMGLRYLEYGVSLNESSLLGKYPVESEVYRDPDAIFKKGFVEFHSVYLNNQDVNLDLDRLSVTFVKAFELVRC